MNDFSKRAIPLSLTIFSAAFVAGAPVQTRAQTSPNAAPPSLNAAALDGARAAFEALPEPDRKAIQEALIWTGDYSGTADGTFGRGTFDAITAYQQSAKLPSNGTLNLAARAALQSVAQQARAAAGFSVLDDPKSGVRIGVPSQLLPKQDANPNGGSRWQSTDGKITLDTRVAPPDTTLQSLYDRNVAIQTPGRVVTYKVIRPDFYVIAGETPTGKFYTRYASGPSGIRAFSIGYDKSLAPQIDRLVVAIANSFTPFPTSPITTAAPVMSPATTSPQKSIATNNSGLIGTGIAIGSRQVLTSAAVDTCKSLQAAGLKPQQVSGKGPWVLTFAEDIKATPANVLASPTMEGASLLVVAFTTDGGQVSLNAAPASALDEASINAPLQPGASGAPVLDATGGLVGLVGTVSGDGRKIAGILPAARYPLTLPAKFADAAPKLTGLRADPATQKRAADLVASIKPSLVPIQCLP
ncbi:peptidoglycan-binding protein [Microvirga sp. 2MCAF38]|uniref:peptidoglycan-binding protein n=1 Tax=Microvirga sp. 2MCAF38 TaxID=3232989 RepID=UPI003F9CAB78